MKLTELLSLKVAESIYRISLYISLLVGCFGFNGHLR